MSNSRLPPGAWLSGNSPSGAALGAWTHTDPPKAGHGGWTHTDPPKAGSSDWTHTDPPRAAAAAVQPSPAPLPWAGIHPDWVFGSGEALLGQALRISRDKILRPADQAWPAGRLARAAAAGTALAGSHLWRWDPEFRVKAITCELIGRCQVLGPAVWLIDPGPDPAAPTPQAQRVFVLQGLAQVDMDEQVDKVLRAAVEREDRLPEILSQSGDFWPFFQSLSGLRLANAPRFAELLNVAYDWALQLTMGLKHAVAARRPFQASSLVVPVIATPGHGSLPSGHATMAALTSELLTTLLHAPGDPRADALDRLARRIAFNRVVAGVHFPVDSVAGHALGTQLAWLLAALADPAQPMPAAQTAVFAHGHTLEEIGQRPTLVPAPHAGRTPAPLLTELWQQVRKELRGLRV